MRKHISNVIKAAAFLLILCLSLHWINQVVMPKYILKNNIWPTTSSYNQFYEMEKNTVDVFFLGSSVTVNAFSPQEIYNDYGIRSYNLGSEQQSIFLSYYWLKEALRFQSPQVVVLDTRFLFQIHPGSKINTYEGLIRKCMDSMKWSSVKREAVSDICKIDKSQNEESYYLRNIRFHTRWSDLTEYDFVSDESKYSELKGFSPIETYGTGEYPTFESNGNTESRQEIPDVMKTYMDKTVKLCKDEGIELVLISQPNNPMNDSYNNTLTEYAEENDLDYYNMCSTEIYESLDIKSPKENAADHANLWGAIKMSKYIGELLRDEYDVKPVEDEQYESTRDYYDHIKKNCELVHIDDMEEYLEEIDDDSYTIFIAATDDASAGLTDEVKAGLKKLGLKKDLTDKMRWSYAAVISPENGVSESLISGSEASLSGSIRNKNTFYSVTSCGSYAGTTSTITIDDVDYCQNKRGLNFVVYDNELMKVVDKVTFDTYADCSASR